MKNFTRGLLVGIGVGFLFAPLKGEQLRQVLSERLNEFRNSLPEDSALNHYVNQLSDRVGYTREHFRDYAQQTVSKAIDTGSTLGNRAMHSGQDLAHKAAETGHDLASKARQNGPDIANKAMQTSQDLAQRAAQTSQDLAHKAKQSGQDMTHKIKQPPSSNSSTRIIPESAHAQPREEMH